MIENVVILFATFVVGQVATRTDDVMLFSTYPLVKARNQFILEL